MGALHLASDAQGSQKAATADTSGAAPQFDHPFADGVSVDAISALSSKLAFTPVIPAEFAADATSFIHDPTQTSISQQAVAFVINSAKVGKFDVIEEPAAPTASDDLKAMAGNTCPPGSGCTTSATLVTLNGGQEALLVTGANSVGLIWGSAGHRFDIFGPPTTFTPDIATNLANSFITAGA